MYLTGGVIVIGSLNLQRYPSNKLDLTVYKIHQTLHFPGRDILCNYVSGSLLAYQGVVSHSQATSNWTPDSSLNNSSCFDFDSPPIGYWQMASLMRQMILVSKSAHSAVNIDSIEDDSPGAIRLRHPNTSRYIDARAVSYGR